MPGDCCESGYNLAIETSGRIGSICLGRGSEIIEVATFGTAMGHAVELLPGIDRLCRSHGLSPTGIAEVYVSGGPGSFTGLRIGITVARTLAWSLGVPVVRVPTLDVVAQNALDVDDPPPNVGVILDAKRNKVYAAAFVRVACPADGRTCLGPDDAEMLRFAQHDRRHAPPASLRHSERSEEPPSPSRLEADMPPTRHNAYQRTIEPAECDPDQFFESLPRPAALIGEGIHYTPEAVARSGLRVMPEATFRARAEVVHRLGLSRATAGLFDDPNHLIPIYVRRPEAEELWDQRQKPHPR